MKRVMRGVIRNDGSMQPIYRGLLLYNFSVQKEAMILSMPDGPCLLMREEYEGVEGMYICWGLDMVLYDHLQGYTLLYDDHGRMLPVMERGWYSHIGQAGGNFTSRIEKNDRVFYIQFDNSNYGDVPSYATAGGVSFDSDIWTCEDTAGEIEFDSHDDEYGGTISFARIHDKETTAYLVVDCYGSTFPAWDMVFDDGTDFGVFGYAEVTVEGKEYNINCEGEFFYYPSSDGYVGDEENVRLTSICEENAKSFNKEGIFFER